MIENISPAEADARYDAQIEEPAARLPDPNEADEPISTDKIVFVSYPEASESTGSNRELRFFWVASPYTNGYAG